MKKRHKPKPCTTIWLELEDSTISATRMQAIEVAARLPEPTSGSIGGMGGYPGNPGKSADKVIADAAKIMAFVTKRI